MSSARFVPNEAGLSELRQALARAAFKAGFAIEGAAKAITPVHGDPGQGGRFATFAPGEKPIGGTLRVSIHTAVYVDGQRIDSSEEAGVARLSTPAGRGIEVHVGSALEYAIYVHDGTVSMAARPYLLEAALEVAPDIPRIIAAELPPGWTARGGM